MVGRFQTEKVQCSGCPTGLYQLLSFWRLLSILAAMNMGGVHWDSSVTFQLCLSLHDVLYLIQCINIQCTEGVYILILLRIHTYPYIYIYIYVILLRKYGNSIQYTCKWYAISNYHRFLDHPQKPANWFCFVYSSSDAMESTIMIPFR
jgi:hypothetical protein